MSDDLVTVQLTVRQARALASTASLFSEAMEQSNPEWRGHVEDDGQPPALVSGILALEASLVLAGAEL